MNGKIVKTNERGSATVIALLVLALLLVFVTLAVSRTTNETLATSNDASETRTFTAAEASLENMTQQFDAIFDFQLSPASTDIANIKNSAPPNFTGYNFANDVVQTQASQQVVITGGLLQGLYATRDAWKLTTITTDKSNGVEVELDRTFFNDRVPIFQFGIFYDDDLEFHPGPRFDFGGRVHSNGNLFLAAGTGLYFSSRVSAHREILTDVGRNGRNALSQWGENVWIRDGSGTYQQLKANMGSALKTGGTGGNLFFDNADMPAVSRNPNWSIPNGLFDGNLMALQKDLKLPMKLTRPDVDYIELIKRGKLVGDLWNDGTGTAASPSIIPVISAKADNEVFVISRYANKAGIRVSLADSKAKLPGCVTSTGTAVTTVCGIRLDGDDSGDGSEPGSGEARGYQPRPMTGYQATRLNGERFHIPGRQVWIKVELVSFDQATKLPVTADVTADILSLGVTEPAPRIFESLTRRFEILNPSNYYSQGADTRSIIQLQRFVMSGEVINSSSNWLSDRTWNSTPYNFVITNQQTIPTPTPNPTPNPDPNAVPGLDTGFADHKAHKKLTYIDNNTKYEWIVPFPIKMFDTREGLFNDDVDPTGGTANKVTRNGVMSIVEINVANLRKFLKGDFNSSMPTGTKYYGDTGHVLRSTDVPESNGWVLYISDRRGDRDFDGEYDMEDIYGPCDNTEQPGEDLDGRANDLETDFKTTTNPQGEAPLCSEIDDADMSAVVDHSYFRRAVRLVNGETLPGNYIANSFDTTGFTVASENAIYVQGNYNATGVSSYGTPTPADDYLPQDTSLHVPASVIGDAVIILSNNWKDSRSFRYPFALGSRPASETTIRFAMISGDAKSSYENSPNQGGGDPRLAGGVHNFKRFLENWGGDYLNYSGSLINLYNARNNNGAFKCCNKVYSPPNRNWTFDTSFLSPERLPPGTPFFQVLQLTGFQRINN